MENFDFEWKFYLGDEIDYQKPEFIDSDWRIVNLPHDWSIEGTVSEDNPSGPYGGYFPGGIAWYRKSFFIGEELKTQKIFIEFDGIHMCSEIWINGNATGSHTNGYLGFSMDMTGLLNYGGENTIAVRVDNSQMPSDRWYTGCGIYRHARIKMCSQTYFPYNSAYISSTLDNENNAHLILNYKIINEAKKKASCTLSIEIFDDNNICAAQKTYSFDMETESETHKIFMEDIKQPRLWSTDNPRLYSAVSYLYMDGELADRNITVFGIRKINFNPKTGFELNDKKVFLKGVCLHHDAGALGAALPDRVIERRLQIIQKMGCNSIRLSHNPHSPVLLDLCDRMGILVIDEVFDKWSMKFDGYNSGAESFEEVWEKDVEDFIKRDRNHPCIICWSVGNETIEQGKNTEKGIGILKDLVEKVHALDSSRPVTCALDPKRGKDNEPSEYIKYMDIISYNYQTQYFEGDQKKYPGYTFMSSEVNPYIECIEGTVLEEGILNNRWNAWFSNNESIAGQYIWAAFDYLGESRGWPYKGWYHCLADTCGFRKSYSYFIESLYSQIPMVHISIFDREEDEFKNSQNHWQHPWEIAPVKSHWNWETAKESLKLYTYTNCEAVELFVNGKSLGEKQLNDCDYRTMVWDIEFEVGTITAVAKNGGVATARHELKTADKASNIMLFSDREFLLSDGADVAHIEAVITDEKGTVVPNAANRLRFGISGSGRIIGIDNGDMTCHESYKGTQMPACQGRCLLIVQAERDKGVICVSVKGDGLKPANIEIKAQ